MVFVLFSWFSLARAEPPARCTRQFPSDEAMRQVGKGPITVGDLIAKKPVAGTFTVDGYVTSVHACAPCPEGAVCKPCEDNVWLSPVAGAYKGPLSRDHDLMIYVPDASRLEMLGHYRLAVELCERHSEGPLPDLELRGYSRLD